MVISLSQGNKILQDLQEYCPTIGLKSIILFNYSCQFALTDVLRYHVGFVLTINFCLNYIINFLYSNLSNMNNSKFVVDNIDYHQFIKQLQIIDLQWFHCFHPYCVLYNHLNYNRPTFIKMVFTFLSQLVTWARN